MNRWVPALSTKALGITTALSDEHNEEMCSLLSQQCEGEELNAHAKLISLMAAES